MARIRRRDKADRNGNIWETVNKDSRKLNPKPFCEFYTPLGRVVTKGPNRRRRAGESESEYCASLTPFKGMVIK